MLGHLGAPPFGIARDAILEPLGEGIRIETLRPSLLLEERSGLREREPQVLSQTKEVIKVATLNALNDAAELLGSDLLDRVDGEGDGLR